MTRVWPCFLQSRALHPWPSLSPSTTLFPWLFLDFVKSFRDIALESCLCQDWPCLCACWQSPHACLVMSFHGMLYYTPSQRAIMIHSHTCRTHQVCFNHHNLIYVVNMFPMFKLLAIGSLTWYQNFDSQIYWFWTFLPICFPLCCLSIHVFAWLSACSLGLHIN